MRSWISLNPGELAWNVAGNRESVNPGIYQRTYDLLIEALIPIVVYAL